MEHNEQTEDVSRQFYEYLSNVVVGSEKDVNYRRLFFKVFDLIYDSRDISMISSGSKAEGLDLPGSDIDLMFLLKLWKVYDKSEKKGEIIIETEHANPGFTLLRVPNNKHINLPTQMYQFSFYDSSFILANSDFKNLFEVLHLFVPFHFQGPSLATPVLERDLVPCLQCNKWPSCAGAWLSRSRISGWPSDSLMEDIKHVGVLLVPVGSKCYSDVGNSFEWRFSFSLAEKLLVHSFNHTQLLVYSLLKIFLKEIIDRHDNVAKLLCSYFMKTLLFWVLEESNQLFWIPKKLLVCFMFCIKRLKSWIMCNYIPNYFIPEHNMIDGKISNELRVKVCTIIDKVLSQDGWKCLLSTCFFESFQLNVKIYKAMSEKDIGKTLYPLLDIVEFVVYYGYKYKSFNMSQNRNMSKLARNLFALYLTRGLSRTRRGEDDRNILLHNKHSYTVYKENLASYLIGTYGDAVYGWFGLAMFYYSKQEYYKMSKVLQTASEILSFDLVEISGFSSLSYMTQTLKSSYSECKSFMKKVRHETALHVYTYMLYTQHNVMIHFLLSSCPPNVGFQYLNFLCNLKRNNDMQCQFDLDLLKKAVYNTKNYNISFRMCSILLLHDAYAMYPIPFSRDNLIHDILNVIKPRNSNERSQLLSLMSHCRNTPYPFIDFVNISSVVLMGKLGFERREIDYAIHSLKHLNDCEFETMMKSFFEL